MPEGLVLHEEGPVRLFVALSLPAAPAAHLGAVSGSLRRRWPQLRWTGPQSWHLTLAFLGQVDPGSLTELDRRLARAGSRHAPLSLSLQGGGAYSRPAAARVLWVGVEGDLDGLARLAGSVEAAARRAGLLLPDAGRPYRPHLTLARSREPADVRDPVAALAGYAGPSWTADAVRLIRSRARPGAPPRYDSLSVHPLGPSTR